MKLIWIWRALQCHQIQLRCHQINGCYLWAKADQWLTKSCHFDTVSWRQPMGQCLYAQQASQSVAIQTLFAKVSNERSSFHWMVQAARKCFRHPGFETARMAADGFIIRWLPACRSNVRKSVSSGAVVQWCSGRWDHWLFSPWFVCMSMSRHSHSWTSASHCDALSTAKKVQTVDWWASIGRICNANCEHAAEFCFFNGGIEREGRMFCQFVGCW